MLFSQILLVAAFVLFVLAGLGIPSGRFNLIAWGLACASLAALLGYGGGLFDDDVFAGLEIGIGTPLDVLPVSTPSFSFMAEYANDDVNLGLRGRWKGFAATIGLLDFDDFDRLVLGLRRERAGRAEGRHRWPTREHVWEAWQRFVLLVLHDRVVRPVLALRRRLARGPLR
jgi:hypothetical protein